ncbi:MAG TPA: hypothetical protein V6D06_05220 [Trichocoleus sp.]
MDRLNELEQRLQRIEALMGLHRKIQIHDAAENLETYLEVNKLRQSISDLQQELSAVRAELSALKGDSL